MTFYYFKGDYETARKWEEFYSKNENSDEGKKKEQDRLRRRKHPVNHSVDVLSEEVDVNHMLEEANIGKLFVFIICNLFN